MTDAPKILLFRSDKRMLKFTDVPKANSLEDAENYIEKIDRGINSNEWILWGIQLKEDAILTGTICFWNVDINNDSAEIGYVLHPDYQGRGIMAEAVHAAITFGWKQMKFKQVVACVHLANSRSIKVISRAGFDFLEDKGKEATYILKSSLTPEQC